ncbi:MAG UNVERIFIED_CONTAM: hypothetical protein LVR18_05950 [Planctomycetaceae bacterium]
MPWKEPKLSDEQITRVRTWIDLGAPYDAPLGNRPRKAAAELTVTDADRQFWSFRATADNSCSRCCRCRVVSQPNRPLHSGSTGCRRTHSNATADRRTLIRRGHHSICSDCLRRPQRSKLCQRSGSRCLAQTHRQTARAAPVRRTLGQTLDGRLPLR